MLKLSKRHIFSEPFGALSWAEKGTALKSNMKDFVMNSSVMCPKK